MYRLSFILILFLSSLSHSKVDEGLFSKLLSPGPLIEGHKNLEKTGCLKCHVMGEGVPDKKCLECHKEIDRFVKKKKGFHGNQKKKCLECHADHKGRKFDSTKLDENDFDHDLTTFKLKGKHKDVKCSKCHTKKRSKKNFRKKDPMFLGLSQSCKSCHAKDSIHKFRGEARRKDCGHCHNENSWKVDKKYNHKAISGFALIGAHNRLQCSKCHVPLGKGKKRFKFPGVRQNKCLTCHKQEHGKNISPRFRGDNCLKCHNQESFKISNFKHKRVTGFELSGAHAKLSCESCHKQRSSVRGNKKRYKWTGLKRNCINCHKDPHGFGRHKLKHFLNAKNCLSCHNEGSFKYGNKFSHTAHTRFPLAGKHKKLSCNKCHKRYKKSRNRNYSFKSLTKKTCNTCHANPHLKTFSKKLLRKKCTECHYPISWQKNNIKKAFNHNKDSEFKLTGKHKKLSCAKCHKRKGKITYNIRKRNGSFCASCHNTVHKGQFSEKFMGMACDKCHRTSTFLKRKKFNHNQTGFKITGAHRKVSCKKCHKPTKYRFKSKRRKTMFKVSGLEQRNCAACHKDPHKGGNGRNCTSCHSDRNWKIKKDYHRNLTLTGVHLTLECSECHVEERRLDGVGDNCIVCHQKDDIHAGALPDCGKCHGQNYWEVSNFKHSLTRFPLLGFHRTLECSRCHRDGIYEGRPAECIDCHLQNAQDVASPQHTMPAFEDCGKCHNQFSF